MEAGRQHRWDDEEPLRHAACPYTYLYPFCAFWALEVFERERARKRLAETWKLLSKPTASSLSLCILKPDIFSLPNSSTNDFLPPRSSDPSPPHHLYPPNVSFLRNHRSLVPCRVNTTAAADVPAYVKEPEKPKFLVVEILTLKKIVLLGLMFFNILFNYTILRDTKDVLVLTAKGRLFPS